MCLGLRPSAAGLRVARSSAARIVTARFSIELGRQFGPDLRAQITKLENLPMRPKGPEPDDEAALSAILEGVAAEGAAASVAAER